MQYVLLYKFKRKKMKKLDFITKNQDGKYNEFSVYIGKNGMDMYASDFSEKISEGTDEDIDTSEYTQVDLGDGDNYAEVYIKNINDEDELYLEIEDYIQGVGSYLDNVIYSELSEEEEKDYEDFIEYHTKNG